MNRYRPLKGWIALLCATALLCFSPTSAALAASATAQEAEVPMALEAAPSIRVDAISAILIEASTGQAVFAINADDPRQVASITKLMTILLTLEALDRGEISLDDQVLSSTRASGMGGSQALLDANQYYRLEDLLKSTIVASANDSAVALAEHMAGAEEVFVQRMNARALELGLRDTHYVNSTGLPAQGQHTTARDVAELSRQLDAHPTYYKYSTIWMDTIAHKGGIFRTDPQYPPNGRNRARPA